MPQEWRRRFRWRTIGVTSRWPFTGTGKCKSRHKIWSVYLKGVFWSSSCSCFCGKAHQPKINWLTSPLNLGSRKTRGPDVEWICFTHQLLPLTGHFPCRLTNKLGFFEFRDFSFKHLIDLPGPQSFPYCFSPLPVILLLGRLDSRWRCRERRTTWSWMWTGWEPVDPERNHCTCAPPPSPGRPCPSTTSPTPSRSQNRVNLPASRKENASYILSGKFRNKDTRI